MSEEDADRFQLWYDLDARHGEAFDRLTGALASVDGQEPLLRSAHATGSARESALRRKTLAGAACIALIVASGFAFFAEWPADLATGRGKIGHYRLADGSDLWLDANSAANIEIDGRRRHLRLVRGRMHVAVAHESRQFSVSAAGREVVDIGTAFDVAIEPEGGSTFVTNGRIELRSGTERLPLAAGHGLRWREGEAAPIADDEGSDAAHWRNGEIVFHHRPLAEVIAVLDRYSSKRLVLMNAAAGRRLVSGVVRTKDVSLALSSLAASQNLSASDWGVAILLR